VNSCPKIGIFSLIGSNDVAHRRPALDLRPDDEKTMRPTSRRREISSEADRKTRKRVARQLAPKRRTPTNTGTMNLSMPITPGRR
jgi:hypothetical protein